MTARDRLLRLADALDNEAGFDPGRAIVLAYENMPLSAVLPQLAADIREVLGEGERQ